MPRVQYGDGIYVLFDGNYMIARIRTLPGWMPFKLKPDGVNWGQMTLVPFLTYTSALQVCEIDSLSLEQTNYKRLR